MVNSRSESYKAAGVDVTAGYEAVKKMKPFVESTYIPGVLGSIGGFGGIQHCLIPAPKHVIIDRDKDDNEYYTRLFAKEQSYRSMLRILGY